MSADAEDLPYLFDEVADALQSLNDLVLTVDLDPQDPSSIEAAIQTVEAAIDARVARYRGNAWVESTVSELKAECRAGLLQQAAHEGDVVPRLSVLPQSRSLH